MVFAALRQILNQPLFKRKPILNLKIVDYYVHKFWNHIEHYLQRRF